MNWEAAAGGRTLVLLTGAAKINDFRSKLEFRSRVRKLDVILCAQAWQFRHMFEKTRVFNGFHKTEQNHRACAQKRAAAKLLKTSSF